MWSFGVVVATPSRPAGFPVVLLLGIDAGLAVRAADRPQSIGDWRALFDSPESGPTRVMRPSRSAAAPVLVSLASIPVAGVRLPIFGRLRRAILWGSIAAAVTLVAGGA